MGRVRGRAFFRNPPRRRFSFLSHSSIVSLRSHTPAAPPPAQTHATHSPIHTLTLPLWCSARRGTRHRIQTARPLLFLPMTDQASLLLKKQLKGGVGSDVVKPGRACRGRWGGAEAGQGGGRVLSGARCFVPPPPPSPPPRTRVPGVGRVWPAWCGEGEVGRGGWCRRTPSFAQMAMRTLKKHEKKKNKKTSTPFPPHTELTKKPVDGFSAGLVEDSLFEWAITVMGPPDTY